MIMDRLTTICSLVQHSIGKYPDNTALTYAGREGITYLQMGSAVMETSRLITRTGIRKEDKVAVLGENMPAWGVAYLAVLFTGGITVPILPDFHPSEIMSVIAHSESKLLIISRKQFNRLEKEHTLSSIPVLIMDDLPVKASKELPPAALMEALAEKAKDISGEDLASVIYTSGTTGTSKGVMLSHRNLSWMAVQTLTIQDVNENDRFLSLLPLSHTYENSLGFLLALHTGASIHYLDKAPTPAVLTRALSMVRPTIILSVPLIIEKMYRKQVLPRLTGSVLMRGLFRFGPTRRVLNRMAGRKLMETFGGNLRFFGIGGSRLDPIIEQYLREARFPYAIGYGLTETSPLLAGCSPSNTRWKSTGPALKGVSLKIEHPDPLTGEGEILAKGPNIMKGYYRNREATRKAFTSDGWFRTGDLGAFDKHHYLYLRGRIKNVILGNNGENIYPEEIEAVINGIEGIEESLVIRKHGKLVAMVTLNLNELEENIVRLNEKLIRVTHDTVDETLQEILSFVNQKVNRFSRIQAVMLHPVPFEKTPTHKIKRYLYGD